MKEKTIEKIPYLGLKKISRIKSVKYIGVTAVKNIGHQRHLFLGENCTHQEGFRHILAGQADMDAPAAFSLQPYMV